MVTLRKRKAATETTAASPSSSSQLATPLSRRKTHHSPDAPSDSVSTGTPLPAAPKASKLRSQPFEQGDLIPLSGFGGAILLTDGATTTLESLVDISVGGVVLFTYPKANTPGCR